MAETNCPTCGSRDRWQRFMGGYDTWHTSSPDCRGGCTECPDAWHDEATQSAPTPAIERRPWVTVIPEVEIAGASILHKLPNFKSRTCGSTDPDEGFVLPDEYQPVLSAAAFRADNYHGSSDHIVGYVDTKECDRLMILFAQSRTRHFRGKLMAAASHLRVALSQALPTDDQIILGHIREALKELEAKDVNR